MLDMATLGHKNLKAESGYLPISEKMGPNRSLNLDSRAGVVWLLLL